MLKLVVLGSVASFSSAPTLQCTPTRSAPEAPRPPTKASLTRSLPPGWCSWIVDRTTQHPDHRETQWQDWTGRPTSLRLAAGRHLRLPAARDEHLWSHPRWILASSLYPRPPPHRLMVRAARGPRPQRRSLQVPTRSVLLAHARHHPRRGACDRPTGVRSRVSPLLASRIAVSQ